MNHLDAVIFPTVCVEYAQLQCDWHSTNDPCTVPHSSLLLTLCTECHKLQSWWIHADLILSKTARGYVRNPASYLGGANDLSDLPLLTPVVVPQWEKIYLCLLLLAPPTNGTKD